MIYVLPNFFSLGKRFRDHQCLFCDYFGCKLARHQQTIHKDKIQVKEILSSCGKEKERLLEILRLQGDHQYNLSQIAIGRPNKIIVAGRSENADYKDYGPCPQCFAWLKESHIPQHLTSNICLVERNNPANFSVSSVIHRSQMLCSNQLEQPLSQELQTVLELLQHNVVKDVITSDKLITLMGEEWLLKIKSVCTKSQSCTAKRLQLMGRLLMEMRVLDDTSLSLHEYLVPEKYDLFVDAVINLSSDSGNVLTMTKPTVALKFGHYINIMTSIKETLAIISKSVKDENLAIDFSKLHSKMWPLKVSTMARRILCEQNSYNKNSLPSPYDIRIFKRLLDQELMNFDYKVTSLAAFTYLSQIVEVKLATFNQRTSGEIEAIR